MWINLHFSNDQQGATHLVAKEARLYEEMILRLSS